MRVDISLDPKASHYCKHCGLTMKPTDLFDCSVCDGDMCEPRRRAKRLRDAERTAAGRKGCADRDRADAIAAARHVRAERPACLVARAVALDCDVDLMHAERPPRGWVLSFVSNGTDHRHLQSAMRGDDVLSILSQLLDEVEAARLKRPCNE